MKPSGSLDVVPSRDTVCPVMLLVKRAMGGRFGADTLTSWLVDADAPRLSVTVNVTRKSPVTAKSCVGVTPVAVAPSPKSHAYDTIEPSESPEPEASNATDVPVMPVVNDAVGATLG
jgi:hypothetical protein